VALTKLAVDPSLFRLPARVEHAAGGTLAIDSAAVFAIRTLAHALRLGEDGAPPGQDGPSASLRAGLATALPDDLRELVPALLCDLPEDLSALAVAVGAPPDDDPDRPPTRIAVSSDGDRFRWAALTERATIPERVVPVKPRLVDDLVRRLTAPIPQDAARLPGMLRRWVIPEDFQNHISPDSPLVLEVNGAAARLPWEFLTDQAFESGDDPLPLAVRTPIARQLRTTYSRAVADYAEPSRLRALVVADPGSPNDRLPGAQKEGLELAELLRKRGIDVTLFVGPPGSTPPKGAAVATELDVLTELLVGRYDIVHYAGHGTMPEPDRPELAGWLFADGVLAARELAQMTWAPRLVTANACWSASGAGGAGTPFDRVAAAPLTAVLADEFLRVGVAHYIGTSWAIPDDMGCQFAKTFYEQVLPTAGRRGKPFGDALTAARRVLFGMRGTSQATASPEVWSGWAAYQHYGDPADVLDTFESAGTAPQDGIRAPASPAPTEEEAGHPGGGA
jgi:CHAT domain